MEGMGATEFFRTFGEPGGVTVDKFDDHAERTAFMDRICEGLNDDVLVA